jgi:DNA-binding MarR family transcriptional regulator
VGPVQQPPSVTTRVAHVLRRALARAEASDAAALAELDLAVRQYDVLALLQDGPRTRQHEVGAALGLDRSTTAALMRALAERGLVHREPVPGNARTFVLRLTPEGERLRGAGERRLRSAEEALLGPLAPADRAALRAALARLVDPGPS